MHRKAEKELVPGRTRDDDNAARRRLDRRKRETDLCYTTLGLPVISERARPPRGAGSRWSGSKSLLFRHHGAPAGAELLIRNSSKFRAPTMRRRRPPARYAASFLGCYSTTDSASFLGRYSTIENIRPLVRLEQFESAAGEDGGDRIVRPALLLG
jgi:hypothetical protein